MVFRNITNGALNKLKGEEADIGYIIITLILALLFAFGCDCISWWIGMKLWNYLLPVVFNFNHPITFWQFAGLDILLSLLIPHSSVNYEKEK